MNLLTKVASWQLSNSTVVGDNITFTAAGYAIGTIPVTELAGLADNFEFSGTCIPAQSGYDNKFTMTVRLQYRDLSIQQQTLLLSNNKGTYCRIPFTMSIDNILSCSILFYALDACQVIGAYLENLVQSIDSIIAGLQKELPDVLLDFNDYDIELPAYEEYMIAMITAKVYKLTDINGHLSCRYFASEPTIIIVRFYDAQAECLFSPIVYNVQGGDGCIGIPHVYPSVADGYHNFMVTVMSTTGTVYIDTRSVQYSIDGNGLTEGLEDAPATLEDIAAYTDSAGTFKGVYGASLTGSTANIRHADYFEDLAMNWITDFSISNILDIAIEFDGNWFEFDTARLLLTDPLPMIAYVEKPASEGQPNTLYLQRFNDIGTRRTVATDVYQVELLRAWKYIDIHTHNDMGFIIAYIKNDGKVYYRSLIQGTDGGTLFEQELEIVFVGGTPPYEHLSLNRLNDFRVAVTVRDSLGNGFSLITPRYYQGDSVESYNVPITTSLYLCKLARPVYPEFTYAENTARTKTQAFFNMKVNTPIEDIKSYFGLKDAATTYAISNVTPIFDPQDVADLEGVLDENGIQLLPAQCIGLEFEHARILFETNPGTLTFTNSGTDATGPLLAISDTRPFSVPTKAMQFEIPDRSIHAYGGTPETDNVKVGVTFTLVLKGMTEYKAYHAANVSVAPTPLIDNIQIYTMNTDKPAHNVGTSMTPIIVLTKVGTDPL